MNDGMWRSLVIGLWCLGTTGAGAATAADYWICVDNLGVRHAQDRPCPETQATLKQPPGVVANSAEQPTVGPAAVPAAQSSETPPTSSVVTSSQVRERVQPSREPPSGNPFQSIIDTAVQGLGLTAVLIFFIFVVRDALAAWAPSARRVTRPTTASESPEPESPEPPAPARADPVSVSPASPPKPAWSLELLKTMDWKRFEELCQRYWVLKGFPAELTGPGGDGGIDIRIADSRVPDRVFAVAQCKAWSNQPVGVDKVRELWGAAAHFEAKLAIFYGVSGFTQEARAFTTGKHLRLISGAELLHQIATQLTAADRESLLSQVTRGDYTTPSCPQCESRLVLNPKRPDYWSCPGFPRCGYRGLRIAKAVRGDAGVRSAR